MFETTAKPLIKVKSPRVWEIDLLRGVAVIAMCFDHLMYDLAFFAGWFSNSKAVANPFMTQLSDLAKAYWRSGYLSAAGFRFWAHYIFVFLFLFLVGVSCAFSRDNAKRGSMLAVVAMAFTGVSFVLKAIGFMSHGIIFGILDCIALSILCAAAVDGATKFDKIFNIFIPLVLGVGILGAGIAAEFYNTAPLFDKTFNQDHLFGYILGANAYGDDWFGLFPYVGAVLVGMYFGKTAYSARKSLLPCLDGKWNKPFTFVGRHALIFYLAHQVAMAGIVAAVCLCMGYRF